MSLVDEYRRQFAWRDWKGALSRCPIVPGQAVLDLGCGAGDVSGLLAARGLSVTGVDRDEALIAAARQKYPGCRFEQQDLRELALAPRTFDGLWSSFAAAYLVDFSDQFPRWCSLLERRAWVCIIEIDDLLGHEPLSVDSRRRIEEFYGEAFDERRYDFRSGAAMPQAVAAAGFQCAVTELEDPELAFDGPATTEVLEAWRARLARMQGLKRFLGARFPDIASELLDCLARPEHRSRCRVVCCVASR